MRWFFKKAVKENLSTTINDYIQWLLQSVHSSFKKLSSEQIVAEINSSAYQLWTIQNLGNSVANIYKDKLDQLWAVQKKYIEDKLTGKDVVASVHLEQSITIEKLCYGIHRFIPTLLDVKPVYRIKDKGHTIIVSEYDSANNLFLLCDPFDEVKEILVGRIHSYPKDRLCIKPKDLEEIISNVALSVRSF